MLDAVILNEDAYTQMKSAQTSYTMAMICSFVGGFMVGWPIGAAVGGGDPNWTMAGVGAGFIVASIPISRNFNKKAMQAIDAYNGGLPKNAFWDTRELKISISENRMGLCFSF